MIVTRSRRQFWSSGARRINTANPLTRGLRALYILSDPLDWSINLVTGAREGAIAGAGVTWVDGLMQTPGTTGGGVTLPTGIASNAVPISLAWGSLPVSGSVIWSLLDNAAFNWHGWYQSADGTVTSTSANSFDGSLALTTGESRRGVRRYAITHESGSSLFGAALGSARLTDSANTAPSGFAGPISLGWANRSADDNPGVAKFEYFAVWERPLSAAEQDAINADPYQLCAPASRIVHFAAAGGAAELAGAGTAGATGTGALTTAIPIVGAAVASASGAGALSTAISLVGASATVSASGSGNLTTTIRLAGAALASVAGAGSLTAQITLSGAALASVVGTGALTTAPAGLAGDAAGGATGTGTLTTGIALAGSASVSAIGAGGLVTGIPLSGGATAAVTGSGDLAITLSGLSGAALASVVGGGALLTSITLSGAALASALGSGVLTTIGVETYGIRGVRGAQVQGRKRPAQITRAKRRN